MTLYTSQVTITLPASMAAIAAKVSKAMDPDAGGELGFSKMITGYTGSGINQTPIYGPNIQMRTLCTDDFAGQVAAMKLDANLLHGAVAADYASRWKDLTPPTLADCQAFLAAIIPEPEPVAPVLP